MKCTFLGETPVLYPMLADYPAEGEAQNLEAEFGTEAEFVNGPPPGHWVPSSAEVTKQVKAAKAARAKAAAAEAPADAADETEKVTE